ncbi:hypothetical protein CHS0354_031095 [Potamilus streckersoni]|uniref:Uncharacterized protein n=1 Tax=Potamilus streckersoni TaxID=2493646 RepID=A0AAE0S2V0_9BIVA|nr:hypothetical protein CHS0354_031095 [Potamilus streckersoni]
MQLILWEEALKSKKRRCLQILTIIVCLISMYSVIFLMTEMFSFYVEMAVYTSVGIILNVKITLKYIPLIFQLFIYANNCFKDVMDRYLSFNKILHSVLQELPKEKVDEVMYYHGDQQRNHAFRVKPDDLSTLEDPVSMVETETGYLRWRTSKLLHFLGKNDMFFVPRKFFAACKMPHYSCPGELLFNYLRAFGELSTIISFLLFVLVIVLAFAETYQLSATNQFLATLAGGFLPLIFSKVVFRIHAPLSLDKANINFKTCFRELLERYKQDWPIDDIVVHKYSGDVISGTGVTTNAQSSYIDENDTSSIDENDRHSVCSKTSSRLPLAENTDAIMKAELNRTDLLIDVSDIEFR